MDNFHGIEEQGEGSAGYFDAPNEDVGCEQEDQTFVDHGEVELDQMLRGGERADTNDREYRKFKTMVEDSKTPLYNGCKAVAWRQNRLGENLGGGEKVGEARRGGARQPCWHRAMRGGATLAGAPFGLVSTSTTALLPRWHGHGASVAGAAMLGYGASHSGVQKGPFPV